SFSAPSSSAAAAEPASVVATQPLPALVPSASPVKGAGPAGTQPLPAPPSSEAPVESVFGATQPLPAVVPSATPADAPAAVKSSPGVPGYAIAYTPKDGPSTPAVVIAPEARSEPENLRPMS